MAGLARHVLAEYYGCDPAKLDDAAYLAPLLEKAAKAANATVVQTCLHRFAPQGVSGVVILAESHLAIHTWPEYGYASVEVFTCGSQADPEAGHQYLLDNLNPTHHEIKVLTRGDLEVIKRYPVPEAEAKEYAELQKFSQGFI